jgi:hypothetical protein
MENEIHVKNMSSVCWKRSKRWCGSIGTLGLNSFERSGAVHEHQFFWQLECEFIEM